MADPNDQAGGATPGGIDNPFTEWWEWAAKHNPMAPPAAAGLAEQFRLTTTAMAALSEVASKPMDDFLAAQRRFAETLEAWAETQKAVADQAIALARQQRAVVDALDQWTSPLRGLAIRRPDPD